MFCTALFCCTFSLHCVCVCMQCVFACVPGGGCCALRCTLVLSEHPKKPKKRKQKKSPRREKYPNQKMDGSIRVRLLGKMCWGSSTRFIGFSFFFVLFSVCLRLVGESNYVTRIGMKSSCRGLLHLIDYTSEAAERVHKTVDNKKLSFPRSGRQWCRSAGSAEVMPFCLSDNHDLS